MGIIEDIRRALRARAAKSVFEALREEVKDSAGSALDELNQFIKAMASLPQGQRVRQVRHTFEEIRDFTHTFASLIKGINGSGQDLCNDLDITLVGYIAGLQQFRDRCEGMAV